MSPDPLTLEAEAQQVLDELWSEKLIPFALNVGKMTNDDIGDYTLHFYDSRIRTARVPITADQPFEELVRAAVLERVEKISGPLRKSPNEGQD